MPPRSQASRAVWALGLLLAGSPLGGAELLPAFSARLDGARYVPADRDFVWVGWVGAGATLVRRGELRLELGADVETILGSERRSFDANQANYHLELHAAREWKGGELALFFHHVSRHASDRDKPEVRNWNVLGLGLRKPLPAALRVPGRFWLSAGRALYAFQLGYRWEAAGGVELELVRRAGWRLYLDGALRAVDAEPQPEFPRGGFLDARLELGARVPGARSAIEVYVALESRNDVSLFLPEHRTGARLGLRFALGGEGP